MKPLRGVVLLGCIVAATGCVPRQEPPPSPRQPERPVAPPVRTLLPPAPQANWQDLPLTQGRWSYRNEGATSLALYGPAGGEPSFEVRCDRAQRQVTLSRVGAAASNVLTVRTSYSARSLPASAQTQPGAVAASVPASDRFLDSIAFSRGRFTVEVPGAPMLVIPAWPEPARVVEDCRG